MNLRDVKIGQPIIYRYSRGWHLFIPNEVFKNKILGDLFVNRAHTLTKTKWGLANRAPGITQGEAIANFVVPDAELWNDVMKKGRALIKLIFK
jgi:hypothetical protein